MKCNVDGSERWEPEQGTEAILIGAMTGHLAENGAIQQ